MSSSTTTPVDTGSTESESSVAQYFAEHPRMLGATFTVLLLLTQVGNVAASESSTISGP
jgi:hypothetical protein